MDQIMNSRMTIEEVIVNRKEVRFEWSELKWEEGRKTERCKGKLWAHARATRIFRCSSPITSAFEPVVEINPAPLWEDEQLGELYH